LHEALTILGFRSLHDGGPETHDAVRRSIDAGEPLLSNLDPQLDAFSDVGVLSRRFRILDAQYPGSRFVLTVRPVDVWIDSRRRHVERNLRRLEAGDYDGTFVVIDEPKWNAEWDLHMERVHTYFARRSNFLEVDLTKNPEWGPLCRFLGVDEPETPFPWANRDAVLHGTEGGTDEGTDAGLQVAGELPLVAEEHLDAGHEKEE
jgi:Sulfotransferase domain